MECPLITVLEDYRKGVCTIDQAHNALHKFIELLAIEEKGQPSGMVIPKGMADMFRQMGIPLPPYVRVEGEDKDPEDKPELFHFHMNWDDNKLHVSGPLDFEIDIPKDRPAVVRLAKYLVKCVNSQWDDDKAKKILVKKGKKNGKNDRY